MKKRIWIWLSLVCILCVQFLSATVHASETPDGLKEIYAQSAVLMDADSGRILFGKEEKKVRPMASTTKIMTCILTLENMEEGQIASVSDYASGQPKVRLGVRGKEEYYIEDLLYSLMLESHNDSAVVIAESIGGNVEGFAALMNKKAKELGCEDTHFVTPNGLDAEDKGGIHATTAGDLARIMRYCIMESSKKEEFLAITRTKDYTFTNVSGDRQFSCHNHNAFLDMMDGALTGKTGFTGDAGYCYVGALRSGKRTFIVALLACGWPNNKGYKWKDTRKLMEYALDNYEYQNVWQERKLSPVTVTDGVNEQDPFQKDSQAEATIKVPDGEKRGKLEILIGKNEEVEILTEVENKLEAPVKAGEKTGRITYILNGEKIKTYDVVTLNRVKRRSFSWCLGWALQRICL